MRAQASSVEAVDGRSRCERRRDEDGLPPLNHKSVCMATRISTAFTTSRPAVHANSAAGGSDMRDSCSAGGVLVAVKRKTK